MHLFVNSYSVLSTEFKSLDRVWYKWVGRNAYSYDHLVYLYSYGLAFYWHWLAASACVRLTQFHYLKYGSLYSSLLVCDIFYRVVQCEEVDSLLLCVLHLLKTCWHLCL